MKRSILAVLALLMAIGLHPQAAQAQPADPNTVTLSTLWYWITHGQDPRLTYGGWVVGAGTGVASYYMTKKHGYPQHRPVSIGTAYGVTTFACAVATPFVDTVLLNRPLTPREMYIGVGDCIVPFIGGWLVDTYLPHDAWTDGTPPAPVHHHK
jgi:hypothetical protein